MDHAYERGGAVERVTGIGGVFVRARDPDRINHWYATHLGVDLAPESYDVSPWWQQSGPTVLAAMSADSEVLGGPDHSWSLNFRVVDLDAMISQLRGVGIDVEVDPEEYPNGRFASLRDPEGNVVQLWEPARADSRGPA
jgi:glyoxylase I family protein